MKTKKITAAVLAVMLAAGTVALPFSEAIEFPYAVTASAADSIVFEAEDVVTKGSVVNKSGYSGGKAVQMGDGSSTVNFKVNVAEAGKYNLTINTAGNGGDKKNVLTVNGSVLGEMSSANGTVGATTIKNINLNKGENIINVGGDGSWGWIFIDNFSIEKVENYDASAQYKVKNVLSNPDATTEAKSVYSYICDNFGKKVLSGQQEGCGSNKDTEMEYIQSTTGKLPLIRGLDFMNNDFNGVVDRAIEWWDNGNGGIVTICWHTGIESSGYDESKSNPFPNDLLEKNSENYKKLIASWDKAADALKKLQDARVPVLWRPFHEFDGQWFWWGKGGSEKFKALWKEMYTYFTEEKGLNNLIWVLGYAGDVKDNWYVGNDYCDIIGSDTYAGGTNKSAWDKLINLNTGKPVSFHECGEIPSVQDMENNDDLWSWFMCWHSSGSENWLRDYNTDLKGIYNSDLVITKDELPEGGLKTYGSNDPVIAFNTGRITIERDSSTEELKAVTNNAEGKTIEWKSSDENVCKVDSNGKITALIPGTATITAKISGTDVYDTCIVTVTNYALTLDSDKVKRKAGTTYYLEAYTNAKDEIEWTSDNPQVCAVDNTGKLTCISAGTATITATLKKYNVSASAVVTVYDKSTISLDKTSLTLKTGASSKITADTASSAGIEWSTSNPKICTVDSNGNVKGISAGTAKITAKLIGNGNTATCTVTVTNPEPAKQSISNAAVKLSVSSVVYNGKARVPSVTVTLGGKKLVSGKDYTVKYTSNTNPGIAYVTITGKGNYISSKKVSFRIAPKAVSTVKLSAVTPTSATIKWNKVTGATGYKVMLYTGGKWVTRAVTSATSVKIANPKLASASTYYVIVRAYKKAGSTVIYSANSPKLKFVTKPANVAKVYAASKAKKSVTAAWKASKGASGYEVQITSSPKLKGGVYRTTGTKLTLAKKLVSNRVYYVRVRAYKTLGKTRYYSGWTKVLKVRAK